MEHCRSRLKSLWDLGLSRCCRLWLAFLQLFASQMNPCDRWSRGGRNRSGTTMICGSSRVYDMISKETHWFEKLPVAPQISRRCAWAWMRTYSMFYTQCYRSCCTQSSKLHIISKLARYSLRRKRFTSAILNLRCARRLPIIPTSRLPSFATTSNTSVGNSRSSNEQGDDLGHCG